MSPVPRYTYLISRNLDPVFALSIGLAAAATRIRREQGEKGRTDAQTWASLQRRVGALFAGDGEKKVVK